MSEISFDSLSSLAADVRRQDRDRYLATLFAPAPQREALFALYAFDHEIAKVRARVTEPMAGLIRLQWWRDALNGLDQGEVLAHPIVQALDRAKTNQGLVFEPLRLAIDARERELEEAPPKANAEFELHLARCHGGIVGTAVRLLGGDEPCLFQAADQLGHCLGLLERLWTLGEIPGGRQPWLPLDLFDGYGDEEAEKPPGEGEAGQVRFRDLKSRLAAQALDYLCLARKDGRRLSRGLLPAFLPGTLAEFRLLRVNDPGFRENPVMASAPFRLLWRWIRQGF